MIKNRLKTKLLFLILFVIFNTAVFYTTQFFQEKRVKIVLDDSLKSLQIHYDILLQNQRLTADAAYASTTTLTPGFLRIMKKASKSTPREKKLLREKLKRLLTERYRILKDQGVLQYQFVLPNNEVFLRMHKPSKFGDNISTIRKDFRFTNKTFRQSQGFLAGTVAHAFRNVYPIFDEKGNYLGAMDVSFSSDSVQVYLSGTSKIHTHFIVHKEVFDAKRFEKDDLVLKYMESGEHEAYMLTLNTSHTKDKCVIQNRAKLQKVKNKINYAIENKKPFAVHAMQDSNQVDVVAFLPILNSEKTKTLAWIVSHKQSAFIYEDIQTILAVRIILFVVFFILLLLIYRVLKAKDKVLEEQKFVNDILSSTHDIVFATDFKTVNFSNKKFKEFFGIKNSKEFNKKMNNDLATIFLAVDGHLHRGLMKEKESVYEFIKNTPINDRLVSIVNSKGETTIFHINITKTSHTEDGFYLVTLGDFAKIQEKEREIIKRSYLDELTGIYNKIKFEELAELELKRDNRYKRDLSLAVVEIDNFKALNELDSTLLGDKAVIIFASNLRNTLRETDIFARYDRNKFIIIFPEALKEDIINICQKLTNSLESLTLPNDNQVETSFGITQYTENDSLNSMLERCNNAVEEFKKTKERSPKEKEIVENI
ncbi:MAG: GGDEF domain-containing protein [Campylobacterota bacterium]|nr:GGDEF domain-containing protein [Campylobacterota bacterium]